MNDEAKVKQRVYMVCDWTDARAQAIDGAPDIGVEYMGNCGGRILREDGSELGHHWSSSFGWLRRDLLEKLDDPARYEVIDLIGQPVPERFDTNPAPPRLDEFDYVEWLTIARKFKPDMPEPEFKVKWDEFQAEKQRREAQKS